MKQMSFFPSQRVEFGGSLLSGKRKTLRPLSRNKPIHIVLKANSSVLFQNKSIVIRLLKKYSRRQGVKLYSFSVQRNHLHLAAKFCGREFYNRFIRALASQLARKIGRGLWKFRPYTRVTEWGRAFGHLKNYILQNEMEVLGLTPYKQRKKRMKKE